MKQLSIIFPLLLGEVVESFSTVSLRAPGTLQQKQPFAVGSVPGKSKTTKLSPVPTWQQVISNAIFNLVKGLVGSGVLCLPAGIAAYGNAPSAVLPAVALIALIGFFSAYGFSLIGRVCSYTGAVSYPDAWSKSVSKESSSVIAVSTLLKTIGAVLRATV